MFSSYNFPPTCQYLKYISFQHTIFMFLMEKRRNTYFGEYRCHIQLLEYPTPPSSHFSNTPKMNQSILTPDFLAQFGQKVLNFGHFYDIKQATAPNSLVQSKGVSEKHKDALYIRNYDLYALIVYGSIMPKIFLGAPNVLKGFRHPARRQLIALLNLSVQR